MSSYLVTKYSSFLSPEDFASLFTYLKEEYGSISEAAKICGIERKTIYDWETSGYLKPITRKKVLQALLESKPDETITFIAKRMLEALIELMQVHVSTIYESAMRGDKQQFLSLARRFDEIKREYGGLIAEKLDREVGDLGAQLASHAKSLGVTWAPEPMQFFSMSRLQQMLPAIMREARDTSDLAEAQRIATRLTVPRQLVETVAKTQEESLRLTKPIPITPEVEFFLPRHEQGQLEKSIMSSGTISASVVYPEQSLPNRDWVIVAQTTPRRRSSSITEVE